MRELPVRLPPPAPLRQGTPIRGVFFFIASFGAVFLAALLAMNVLGL